MNNVRSRSCRTTSAGTVTEPGWWLLRWSTRRLLTYICKHETIFHTAWYIQVNWDYIAEALGDHVGSRGVKLP